MVRLTRRTFVYARTESPRLSTARSISRSASGMAPLRSHVRRLARRRATARTGPRAGSFHAGTHDHTAVARRALAQRAGLHGLERHVHVESIQQRSRDTPTVALDPIGRAHAKSRRGSSA